MAFHADAEHRELGHLGIVARRRAVEQLGLVGGHAQGGAQIVLRHRDRDIRPILASDALYDNVDDDARLGQFVENLGGQARDVGQTDKGNAGLRLVEIDPFDDELFQALEVGNQFGGAWRRQSGRRGIRISAAVGGGTCN